MSYQRVVIMGNLGADPEYNSEVGVARLSVATTRKWKTKEGEQQEETTWHRVNVWGRAAENASKYLSKGRGVLVEGYIKDGKYTDKDGVERYTKDIVADNVQYLPGGQREEKPPF